MGSGMIKRSVPIDLIFSQDNLLFAAAIGEQKGGYVDIVWQFQCAKCHLAKIVLQASHRRLGGPLIIGPQGAMKTLTVNAKSDVIGFVSLFEARHALILPADAEKTSDTKPVQDQCCHQNDTKPNLAANKGLTPFDVSPLVVRWA